jgi:chemotaxis protein histidine kinase CheA
MSFIVPMSKKKDYLNRRFEELQNLELETREDNKHLKEKLLGTLHQIKGNAKTFGFEELGLKAQELENFIKITASIEVKKLTIFIEELKTMVKKLQSLLP